MILCNKDCIPCCDFCIHATHFMINIDGRQVKGGPDGCKLHPDKEHQDTAIGCGYCDDYHCFNAKEDDIVNMVREVLDDLDIPYNNTSDKFVVGEDMFKCGR